MLNRLYNDAFLTAQSLMSRDAYFTAPNGYRFKWKNNSDRLKLTTGISTTIGTYKYDSPCIKWHRSLFDIDNNVSKDFITDVDKARGSFESTFGNLERIMDDEPSMIVARSLNHVIGKDGKIPWKIKSDMNLFTRLTFWKPIIMGRKTWESIDNFLFYRGNIVISKKWAAYPDKHPRGVQCFGAPVEAFRINRNAVVIGGEEIYEACLPFVKNIFETIVDVECEGDTYFPELVESHWQSRDLFHQPQNDDNEYSFTVKHHFRS